MSANMSSSSSGSDLENPRSEMRPMHGTERNTNQDGKTKAVLQKMLPILKAPIREGHIISDVKTLLAIVLAILCFIQFLFMRRLKDGLVRFENDSFDNMFSHVQRDSPDLWREDRLNFIHNAIPVGVHSHNDYLQRLPLFEALGSGCISIEADIHHRDSELYVAHTTSSLNDDRTLRSMYLNPLQRLLERRNSNRTDGSWVGFFDRAPEQTLVLLIDQKTSGSATFEELDAQLQPLRDLDLLTYWNGTDRVMRPLTIVASGNAPFESVLALKGHRDIFYDAKLERISSRYDDFSVAPPRYGYNQSNSYYASTEWRNARFGPSRHPSLSEPNSTVFRDATASHMEQAAARGLLTRYWNIPTSPPNLREVAWRCLIQNQVGVLNMDDLGIVRARAIGWAKHEVPEISNKILIQ